MGREEKWEGKRREKGKEGNRGGALSGLDDLFMEKKQNSSLKCVVSGCRINHIHVLVTRQLYCIRIGAMDTR